jgi:hypothetical protein
MRVRGLNVTNGPADSNALAVFRADLIKIRDEAANVINRLDENPPETEEEYLAEKTRLMTVFANASVLAIQVPIA